MAATARISILYILLKRAVVIFIGDFLSTYDGTPCELKGSRTVWSGGNLEIVTKGYLSLFVDWVFYNVTDGEYVIGHGGGVHMQHTYCTPISWNEAQPGDLVFYPG